MQVAGGAESGGGKPNGEIAKLAVGITACGKRPLSHGFNNVGVRSQVGLTGVAVGRRSAIARTGDVRRRGPVTLARRNAVS